MKKSFLISIIFFQFIFFNLMATPPSHYMPLTVDITINPDKEVYYPGDVIEVNFHAYFNKEILEEGKKYLLRHWFSKGRKLYRSKNINRGTKKIRFEVAEVIETSYLDTLIYFKNVNEEYTGNFKLKIQTECDEIVLTFDTFGLGSKYYEGRRMGGCFKIGEKKIYYYESKNYKKQNKTEMKYNKPLKKPLPNNYPEIKKTNEETRNTGRERELFMKYLINTSNEEVYEDEPGVTEYVHCTNEFAGYCEYVDPWTFIFHTTGNIGETGVIYLDLSQIDYFADIELVENYPFRGYVEFHEIDDSQQEPIYNPANGVVYLYDQNNPNNYIASEPLIDGSFNFGDITIQNPIIQIAAEGSYYSVVEGDLCTIKARGVEFINPCAFPELWYEDYLGLITYRYQKDELTTEPFSYEEGIGLIWREHRTDFCGGLHILQQAKRFDDYSGFPDDRDFFGIWFDENNSIVGLNNSCYLPEGSIYNPTAFDIVYIHYENPEYNIPPYQWDQWDNSVILHELAHAYHFDLCYWSSTTLSPHYWELISDDPTAMAEGFAYLVSCLIKKETDQDEWDDVIYEEPCWYTDFVYNEDGSYTFVLYANLEIVFPPIPPMFPGLGNECEGHVACFLWDLFDPENDPGNNDELTYGFNHIWNVLHSYHDEAIHFFLDHFYEVELDPAHQEAFINLCNYHQLTFSQNEPYEVFYYPEDFEGMSVQEAINSDILNEGDVLILSSDMYNEPLTINRRITLASYFFETGNVNFIENTIINTGFGNTAITLNMDASYGKIIGLTINNNQKGVSFNYIDNFYLNNCIIESNDDGIDGFESSMKIKDCIIQNNLNGLRSVHNWDRDNNLREYFSTKIYKTKFFHNGTSITTDANIYLEKCTLVDNTTCINSGSHYTELLNCILWDNDTNFNSSYLSIQYSDIEGGYQGIGNINSDPLFIEPYEDCNLTVLSPCIDSGDPYLYLDPDETLSDMGCYYFHHDYDIKRFEEGIQWSSFPYLKDQGTSNGEIYEQAYWNVLAQTPGLLQETYQGDPTIDGFDIIYGKRDTEMYIDYVYPNFNDNGFGNMLFRHEGYKIQIIEGADPSILIVDGERLVYYEIDMTVLENYWLGYYLPQPQNIEDAFGDYWVDVNKVWAEDWYYDRLNIIRVGEPVSANSTTGKTLEYGKMYIVQMYDDITGFHWNGATAVEAPSRKAETQYFTYTEKADYEAIDVVNIPPNVTEIGVFEEDVCVGAVVVEDSCAQILVYSDNANRDPSPFTFEIVNEGRFQLPIKNYEVFNWHTCEFESGIIISGMQEYSIVMLGEEGEPEVTPTITKIELHSNFPNPFNPSTTISFSLPKEKNIELTIYNIKGQKVKTLYSGIAEEGKHSMIWEGIDSNRKTVSSGIYFYRLETKNKELTRKMLLLK